MTTLALPLLLCACARPDAAVTLACQPATAANPPVSSAAYQDKSLADLKSLASNGDLAAARVAGERYEHGVGTQADIEEAIRWYEQAAFIPPTTLAVYMPGYGKVPGTTLTIPAGGPRPGDPIAMAHLGWLYIDGTALPFDETHGRELLACAKAHGASGDGNLTFGAALQNLTRKTADHG